MLVTMVNKGKCVMKRRIVALVDILMLNALPVMLKHVPLILFQFIVKVKKKKERGKLRNPILTHPIVVRRVYCHKMLYVPLANLYHGAY